MKKFVSVITLVVLVGMVIAGISRAATDTVTATVTVLYSSISLNRESFAYGSMNSNTASSTLTLWSGAGIIATNNGGTSSFDIYGANTTGSGTGWTLAADNTGNNYIHKFCNDTVDNCTTPPTSYTALTGTPATLDASVANTETVAFQLQIITPTTPTDFSQQSAVVTVQASAI